VRDGVNCRMPQSVRNGRITFRWEEVMQTVPRMADLFKEFLLKIASSQLKRLSQRARAVLYGTVTGCKIMHRARFWRASSQTLCAVVRL